MIQMEYTEGYLLSQNDHLSQKSLLKQADFSFSHFLFQKHATEPILGKEMKTYQDWHTTWSMLSLISLGKIQDMGQKTWIVFALWQ